MAYLALLDPQPQGAIFTADKHTQPDPNVFFIAYKGWNHSAKGNNAVDYNLQTHYFHQPTRVTLINGSAAVFWLDDYDAIMRPYAAEATWKPSFFDFYLIVRPSNVSSPDNLNCKRWIRFGRSDAATHELLFLVVLWWEQLLCW